MTLASLATAARIAQGLRTRLTHREDSEHEQALIRILIAAIVWLYLCFTYIPGTPHTSYQYLLLWLLGLDVGLSALLFCHILWRPAVNPRRRVLGIINDAGMSTLVMFLTGEAGASMIGVYLFVTFGNGFRYGRAYLFACQALCLTGFTSVLLFHPYWSNHQTSGWSLMVALVVLPLYVSTLLKRIEQARARAEEANRAKSTFLANMSHEMRTPLNGIVGAIELFRTTPLDARQSELTRLLQHSVGMLRALVDDVLDIEKIEAGRLTIEIADFDLHGALNGLINLLRPHARNKGLTLTALVDPAIDYHVRGDAHHLSQVLLNLLSNAIKFTESGFVELSVKLKAETATGLVLRFEVRDSGIGIPEVAQAHIFERFVQADDSTTRKYGGTGLGTTIAKQLVEIMGGTIGLVSEVGAGSTFWFQIPLLRAHPEESVVPVIDEVGSAALIVAEDADLPRIQQMAANVCTIFYTTSPDDDVCSYLGRLRSDDVQVSALFYGGGMQRAHELFNQLAEDPRNAATALIYVTSAADYLPGAETLRRIEGVNFIDANAPPRHLRNAIHAATSKGNSVGQVIDLRAVLEEQRQKLKILVAEDNTTNQQIVKQLLERAGHEVIIASDGEEALDLYEVIAPEVAILDFNMPERNGLEVTKTIRAMEAIGVHLPIMILSASVTTEARERARRAGADEFVGKPYDAAELLHTIDRMARRAKSVHRDVAQRDEGKRQSTGEVHALSSKAAVIDARRMAEVQRIAGDSQFLSRLIEGFEKDVIRLLDELDAKVATAQLAAVGDVAHALKGAALGIGAARFGALCVDIEKLAASGQLAATSKAIPQLRGCFRETSTQLGAYISAQRQALGQ